MNFQMFEAKFGRPPHPKFVEFLYIQSLRNFSFIEFSFKDKPFIFIIRSFNNLSEEIHYEESLFKFGINQDGYDLLMNPYDDSLQIIQDEFGVRCELGITIHELLNATIENP